MNEQKNIEVVKQAYEAFKNGDMPTLLGTLGHNVDWEAAVGLGDKVPTGGRRLGLEQVARFFGTLDSNIAFEQFEPREYVAQGDKVVTLGYYKGKAKPTGKTFSSEWAMVFTLQNGKITRFREYTDTYATAAAFANVPVHA